MALGSSHWSKYGDKCTYCKKTEPEVKLTRHHILKNGRRTSQIIVLCVDCHRREHI